METTSLVPCVTVNTDTMLTVNVIYPNPHIRVIVMLKTSNRNAFRALNVKFVWLIILDCQKIRMSKEDSFQRKHVERTKTKYVHYQTQYTFIAIIIQPTYLLASYCK